MRIRSIKPEFWRSDDIDALDWHARLLFIGLWSYVDDNGVGRDRVSDIVADLFAGDLSGNPPETLRRVTEGLETLENGGQIVRYVSEGRRLLYITAWDKHQQISHPNKVRYARPTRGNTESSAISQESSGESPETYPTGAGEQGSSGTEEQGTKRASSTVAELDAEFEEFWKRYPRKVGKGQARNAYRSARKKVRVQVIADALRIYAQAVAGQPVEKIRHPSTWLNGEPWHDDPAALINGIPKPRNQQETEAWLQLAMADAADFDAVNEQKALNP